jgi:flagellar secretion chaperone FliS
MEGENDMTYARPQQQGYLDARVTTASQAELQLIMLEAVLRFGRLARQLWEDESQTVEVDRLLRRGMDVVQELIRSVALGQRPESKRLEEEYAFAFRSLAGAHLKDDLSALDSALRVLDFQRETWRLACEKLKTETGAAASGPAAARTAAPTPKFDSQTAGGFSVQA